MKERVYPSTVNHQTFRIHNIVKTFFHRQFYYTIPLRFLKWTLQCFLLSQRPLHHYSVIRGGIFLPNLKHTCHMRLLVYNEHWDDLSSDDALLLNKIDKQFVILHFRIKPQHLVGAWLWLILFSVSLKENVFNSLVLELFNFSILHSALLQSLQVVKPHDFFRLLVDPQTQQRQKY